MHNTDLSDRQSFLDTIGTDQSTAWMVQLRVCGKEILFKLDAGAEATAVSEECYQALGNHTSPILARSLWTR